MKPDKYASVWWTVDDVLSVMKHWSKEQAEEWLASNEGIIADRMTEMGWSVIDALADDDWAAKL